MPGRTTRDRPVAARVEPVLGAPALRVTPTARSGRPIVIVADLHFGLGSIPDRPGGPPEASVELLVDRLLRLLDAEGSRRLVVAGDVKHPIVGAPPALRPILFDAFARLLASGREVDVVLGNHDVGLARMLPREVRVHSAEGIVVHGVGVFHGHRWPADPVLRARSIAAGHLHPGFRLAPSPEDPSGKRACWVRVRRAPLTPRRRRRGAHAPLAAREIVILPPFNPIAGIEALNRSRPTRGRSFLFRRFLSQGEARAYLLDGTDLGPIPTERPLGPSPAASRARPPR